MITIIDYNAGNIKSIKNMFNRLGVESVITKEKKKIETASKLILPGVGHFDYGMDNLKKSGLIDLLNNQVLIEKIPILGICLGAQMFGNMSEEGKNQGLGWIDMNVIKFDDSRIESGLKIPHMGWSNIEKKKDSKLLSDMADDPRFYFVHSYHMQPNKNSNILCTARHGYNFVAAVEFENIFGVQFHPEKSHKFGMKLLENFAKL